MVGLRRLAVTLAGPVGWAGLVGLLGPLGCDPKDDRARVMSGIERLRSIPPEDAEERLRLASELRKVPLDDDASIQARDACAKAYQTSGELFQLIDRLEATTKSKGPVDNPKLLAAQFREAENLEGVARDELEVCERAVQALRL